jgi:hypothetical protein
MQHMMALAKKSLRGSTASLLPAAMLIACAQPSAYAQQAGDKIVWAHEMGVMPYDSGMQYGSTYPITIYDRNDPAGRANFQKQFVKDVVNSGTTGIAFEILPGKQNYAPGVPQYEAVVKAFAGSGIAVAPCLDTGKTPGSLDDIVQAIEQSYAVAKANGNPALMRDGRLIVFLYGGNHQDPAGWARVRAKVEADGFKVFLAGDAGQANLSVAQAFGNTVALAQNWDAAYNFPGVGMAGADNSNGSYVRTLAPSRRMWVASLMPGYYRGINVGPNNSSAFGIDALGTARMRSIWQDVAQSNIKWVYWITQNDFIEHTNLMPDSTWGYTRSDMNLWYARQFTHAAYPYGAALYLTTPQALHAGEKSVVELAIINPQDTATSANVQLVAQTGEVLGSANVQVGPHALNAVQIPVSGPVAARYTYARAVARGPGGSITSAPILFSREAKLAKDRGATMYYSTNSRLPLPTNWHPAIAAQGDAVSISGVDTSVILAVDLLGNGNLVDQVKYPAGPVSLSRSRVLQFGRDSNDNKNSTFYSDPTAYVVRIVLKNGAIWTSDPLGAGR